MARGSNETRRHNAFDDFVAAGRWLVASGHTTPKRIVARGNSNGGLLVAAALNDHVAPPHDPVKMVARLQAEATGGPFLLLPLRVSGHAGGTTRTAQAEQDLDELAFCWWIVGQKPTTP